MPTTSSTTATRTLPARSVASPRREWTSSSRWRQDPTPSSINPCSNPGAPSPADLNQAIDDGAFRVGEEAGVPIHRFGLGDTSAAHEAVEGGAVGKVLVTLAEATR